MSDESKPVSGGIVSHPHKGETMMKSRNVCWTIVSLVLVLGAIWNFILARMCVATQGIHPSARLFVDEDFYIVPVFIMTPLIAILIAALSRSVLVVIASVALSNGAAWLGVLSKMWRWPGGNTGELLTAWLVIAPVGAAIIGGLFALWAKIIARTDGNRIATSFYFWSIFFSGLLSLALQVLWLVALKERNPKHEVALVLQLCIVSLAAYSVIVFMVFLHKSWASIQYLGAKTTPGRAVGLCFIPIYNFYWIFRAIRGFTRNFNTLTVKCGFPIRRVSDGNAGALCVLVVLSILLFFFLLMLPHAWFVVLLLLTVPVALVKLLVFVCQTARGVNSLPQQPVICSNSDTL